MAEGAMKDLGALVRKTKGIKNRLTGVLQTQVGVDNYTFWENIVRYADNHQEEFEFIYDSAALPDSDEADEVTDFNADGSRKITRQWLDSQHYKVIQKTAKDLGLAVDGSKKELMDRILEAV